MRDRKSDWLSTVRKTTGAHASDPGAVMKEQATITPEMGRFFLTDRIREEVDFRTTRQSRGSRPPAVQKPAPPGASVIALPDREAWKIPPRDLQAAIAGRESHRQFAADPLSLDELLGVDGYDEFVIYMAPVGKLVKGT